ncbi:MAG: AAA family ATPase [Opitutaceae bacterium]|nr:AAA family ATPase [Opitutaceae bacterium]
MIKRINTLKRVGRFVELHSRDANDQEFAQFNVVFASNAAGKSTICDVLRSLATGEPSYVIGRTRLDATTSPEIVLSLNLANQAQVARFQNGTWVLPGGNRPKIHVFDDRFVADNVLVGHHINIEQKRNLYGLVIGDDAIALQQRVSNAEAALNLASAAEGAAKTALERLAPQGYNIETFRTLALVPDADAKIAEAKGTLASATQAQAKADAIRQRRPLPALPISELPANLAHTLSSTLDEATVGAERAIRRHLESKTRGLSLEWIGQGHRAALGQDCPHCGQSMTGLEILQAYNAYFSGELQQQERARAALAELIENSWGEAIRNRIREILTAHENERDWWDGSAGFTFRLPDNLNSSTVLETHRTIQQSMVGALTRKNATPSATVALTPAEEAALAGWQPISEAISVYNAGITDINSALARKKTEVGTTDISSLRQSLATLEAARQRHQQAVIDAYTAYDAAVLAKSGAQRTKQEANDALRDQTNAVFAQYGARINQLLGLFTANFRLVAGATNDRYVSFAGGPPSGQLAVEILGRRIASSPADAADPSRPSLANTLSGGDRSALALAFFLAKVEREPALAESIVVFDDPFHSQDRSRQRRTIEQIHELSRRAAQCFVFSHDLDFARAVTPIHGVSLRTYFLDPLANQTTLESKELPMPPSRAYETKYALLANFVLNPGKNTDHSSLLAIVVTLRTILEEYLQLKFPLRWKSNDWLGTMIGEIRSATGDDPLVSCKGLEVGLSQVNEYSQRFHHRSRGATGDIPDAAELVTYAKQTLGLIHQ